MTGTQRIHSWLVFALMTYTIWVITFNFLVEISFWKFILLVLILAFSDTFCIFVDKKIIKIKDPKPKDKLG